MSARKRHVKCTSESIQKPECDIRNVNTSTKIEEHHGPQSNTISNLTDSYSTCDNETLNQQRMKMLSSTERSPMSQKDSWSTKSITSAIRLGLTVVVIITFLFSLTQIQNVEGQRNRPQGQEEKIPNEQ